MLLQRRRLFRWRTSRLVPLMFLGMICSSELASVNVPQSSSTSSDKKKSPDIGTLNNFKWKAWLLVDTEIDPRELDTDSATQSRRITPKSVFVAPKIELSNCSEGYYADNMGRCVKNVNVNEDAHHLFLLERLNAQYALKPREKNKNQSNGPLQLNIPLTSDLDNRPLTKIEKHELMETFSMNDPILLPVRGLDDEKKTQEETASTTKKDATQLNEEDMIFFRKNLSAISDAIIRNDQKPVVMIPVVELVKETNDTDDLPKTADYKIPMDMKTMLNILSVKGVDVSNVTEEDVSVEKREKNSTQVQPTTLVLLLAPTSLPNLNDDPTSSSTQNNTTDHTTVQSNLTSSNTIAKESGNVSVASSSTVPPDAHGSTVPPDAPSSTFPPDAPVSTIPPKDSTAEVAPIVVDEHRDNETHSEDELKVLENSKLNESQEIGILYDEDEEDVDYTYVTNEPDEDESVEMENEEILKHGEAGITIPTRNVERIQQNQTAASQNKTVDTGDRIVIRFNDTTSADDDDDEADSNVSSDVSIDGDRILETTLLDVNTERLQTTTRLPETIVKSTKNDSKEESFDQRSESEVAFVNEELEAAPTSSESLLYDRPEENPATRTSEEKLNAKKKVVQENPKNIESDVSLTDLGQTTLNLDSTEDYVFFPDNVKRPQQQDGYVRFPSNEANSIHGPTYKQQYPVDDHSFYGGTSTKSSVPVHQKPVYYLTRSSWKPDRPQRDHVPTATTNKRRRPELSFWNKMPLIRDPAIYPVDQVPNDEAASDDQVQHRLLRTSSPASSRRRSSYSEMSSENTMLARN